MVPDAEPDTREYFVRNHEHVDYDLFLLCHSDSDVVMLVTGSRFRVCLCTVNQHYFHSIVVIH